MKYCRVNFFIFEFFLLFPVLCALFHGGNFLFVQSSYISYTKIYYKIFRSKTGKSKKSENHTFFNCVFWENKHLDFAIISRQGSTDRKQRRKQFLDFEIQNFMTKMIHQKHIISWFSWKSRKFRKFLPARPGMSVVKKCVNVDFFLTFLVFPVLCALLHVGNFLFVAISYIEFLRSFARKYYKIDDPRPKS